jgi:CheY-like chemotaxis protein
MPVMDGFRATRVLREREARLSLRAGGPVHTPVIAITASATADYKPGWTIGCKPQEQAVPRAQPMAG